MPPVPVEYLLVILSIMSIHTEVYSASKGKKYLYFYNIYICIYMYSPKGELESMTFKSLFQAKSSMIWPHLPVCESDETELFSMANLKPRFL